MDRLGKKNTANSILVLILMMSIKKSFSVKYIQPEFNKKLLLLHTGDLLKLLVGDEDKQPGHACLIAQLNKS